MRPKLALTVSASPSDNVCFFANIYASYSSEQLPYSYYKAPHITQPPIARTETSAAASIVAAKPTPPHPSLSVQSAAICAIVVLWLCGSLPRPPLSPLPSSRRPEETDRSRSCPSPQRDLLIAFRGATRLCQGASPQEGKQLRRVRL